MKVTVSISDRVFEIAEKLAKQSGTSRSKLYTVAIENYIEKLSAEEITRKLNEVYAEVDSSVEPGLQRVQSKALPKEKW